MGRPKKNKYIVESDDDSNSSNSSDESICDDHISEEIEKKIKKNKKRKNVNMLELYNDALDWMEQFKENNVIEREKKENTTLPWVEKFRPKSLDNIISHKNIIYTLENFISKMQFPHLIFRGPPGTGKTSTIMACAKKMYNQNYSTMVLDINASEERGVDSVRGKISDFASTKGVFLDKSTPTFKLVILDEADAMTQDAQSMLVSVMEKHTKNVRFCLICNYVKKINPAIQSRCVIFKFSPLAKTEIKKKLLEACGSMNIKITNDGIDEILKISKGDMRKVFNILQATSMSYDIINRTNVSICMGYPLSSYIDTIYTSLLKDNFKTSYNKISSILKNNGYALSDVITELTAITLENFVKNKINQKKLLPILINLRDIEMNLTICPDEMNQLSGLIGTFKL